MSLYNSPPNISLDCHGGNDTGTGGDDPARCGAPTKYMESPNTGNLALFPSTVRAPADLQC